MTLHHQRNGSCARVGKYSHALPPARTALSINEYEYFGTKYTSQLESEHSRAWHSCLYFLCRLPSMCLRRPC
ncbi:hypothetical protein BJV74DRAFT_843299 [Russula compacta]|nr:hypothetical protein BJV74DRAFT_843299 [Russula compacta]